MRLFAESFALKVRLYLLFCIISAGRVTCKSPFRFNPVWFDITHTAVKRDVLVSVRR